MFFLYETEIKSEGGEGMVELNLQPPKVSLEAERGVDTSPLYFSFSVSYRIY